MASDGLPMLRRRAFRAHQGGSLGQGLFSPVIDVFFHANAVWSILIFLYMTATKIFISHSDRDRDWADWIDVQLESRGFEVWRDLTTISTGQSFITELNKAIEESDLMVVLMSPDYFNSVWARQETEFAAARKKPIIPVLIKPCEVQGLLQYYNWADLTKDRDMGLLRVVKAVEHLRGERSE
jgi:hypothetical protein